MLIVLIILVLAILAVVTGITSAVKFVSKKNKEKIQEEEKPKDIIINLVATGDVMCHTTNFNAAYNNETKEYDFT